MKPPMLHCLHPHSSSWPRSPFVHMAKSAPSPAVAESGEDRDNLLHRYAQEFVKAVNADVEGLFANPEEAEGLLNDQGNPTEEMNRLVGELIKKALKRVKSELRTSHEMEARLNDAPYLNTLKEVLLRELVVVITRRRIDQLLGQNQELASEIKVADQDGLMKGYRNYNNSDLGKKKWHEELNEIEERARETQQPVIAIMADVDSFKLVNDDLGDLVGDQALIHFAEQLASSIRERDKGKVHLLRIGGEEIAIVLEGIERGEAMIVAERMRAALQANPLYVTRTEIWTEKEVDGQSVKDWESKPPKARDAKADYLKAVSEGMEIQSKGPATFAVLESSQGREGDPIRRIAMEVPLTATFAVLEHQLSHDSNEVDENGIPKNWLETRERGTAGVKLGKNEGKNTVVALASKHRKASRTASRTSIDTSRGHSIKPSDLVS